MNRAASIIPALIPVLSVVLFLISPPAAVAQECGGASEGSEMIDSPEIVLIPDGQGLIGDNYLEIPAFSYVNDKPTNPTKNGFQQLCKIFDLTDTASEILQIDPENGVVQTFYCNQAFAPNFLPCHGVRIRTSGVTPPISGYIPIDDDEEGVEGTWFYPIWAEDPISAEGDNILGIPLTIVSVSPEQLCEDLNLPRDPNSGWATVTWVDPGEGQINTHSCGSLPVWSLIPGSAVIVKSDEVSEGQVSID